MDEIRKMLPNEIPECVKVIRESFKTVADELGFNEKNAPGFTAFSTNEDKLKNQYNENRPMYVYQERGRVVGYYSLQMLDNGSVELNNLSVLPEYRHIGIGEKMLMDAEKKAAEFGRNRIELGIVEENEKLRKWYEKFGFIHTGTKKFDFFPFTCGYMEKYI